MKALFLMFLCLSLAASTVWAQAGTIAIFGNPAATDCALSDQPAALTPYYIIHINTPGATGSQYSAPKPICSTATWLSDTNMFPVTIGNSQQGVSIYYGSCRVSPIHVQTMNFLTFGTTPPCCFYSVCPDPQVESKQIEIVDCAENLLYAHGGTGIINSIVNCTCGCLSIECVEALYRASSNCLGVGVEDVTWGRMKALYTE